VRATADNADPITQVFTIIPPMIPLVDPQVLPPRPPPQFVGGIFNATEGILHFLIITWTLFGLFLLMRTIYYVYRRRYRPEIGFDPVEIPVWQSLVVSNIFVGLFWPCHYRCANVHITLAACTLLGWYTVVSMFYALAEPTAWKSWDFHVFVGFTAAMMQLAARPILSFHFFLYVVHDPKEVEYQPGEVKEVEPEYDALAPYETVDLFEKEEVEDVQAPEGFDGDLLVDDALAMAAASNMAGGGVFGEDDGFGATFGEGMAKGDALGDKDGGIDWATPLDLNDDIVILDEKADEAKEIDDADIEFALDGTVKSQGDGAGKAGVDETLNLDDVDFDALLDEPTKDAAAAPMGASMKKEMSLAEMADGWNATLNKSGTAGDFARAKTLAQLNADLGELGEMEEGEGMFGTGSSYGEESDDYGELVIVTRHLANFRVIAYTICAIFMVLTTIVTYLLTYQWDRAALYQFWLTMMMAFIFDFFFVEWFYIALIWLYRWITMDTDDNDMINEIHPYEGEQEVREY